MRISILAAALLLIPLGAAVAQGVFPTSGDRIRITASRYGLANWTGRVQSVRNDSLFIEVGPGEAMAVALAAVSQLDVSTGTQRHTLKDAGIGALVGVSIGVVIAYANGGDPSDQRFAATVAGAGLGVTGLVIGAIVGTLNVWDRWTSVPLGVASATPILQIGREGARLAVAVPF